MNDEPVGDLARTLFVFSRFPVPSQTFITGELGCFERWGGPVRVLARSRVARDDLDPWVAAIDARAIYLGGRRAVLARGVAWAARNPRRFLPVLSWALRLATRVSGARRTRLLGALVSAAAAAEHVIDSEIRYLHAHFAAEQTEVAMFLARLCDVSYGVSLHAHDIWRQPTLLVEKLAGARVALTCTRHNLEHLRRLAPAHAHKLHLAVHGVDLPTPSPALGRGWLAVGRLVEKKGFAHVIDAVGLLRAAGRSPSLTIIGDGPLRGESRRRIRARGLDQEIQLTGESPHAAVWAALGSAIGLVAPSVRDQDGDLDGLPNVILEAMAAARPVVASRISALPEVVRDGETGLLVPPGDPVALARAMARLEDARELATHLGEGGRALVARDHALDVCARRQLRLLRAPEAPEASE